MMTLNPTYRENIYDELWANDWPVLSVTTDLSFGLVLLIIIVLHLSEPWSELSSCPRHLSRNICNEKNGLRRSHVWLLRVLFHFEAAAAYNFQPDCPSLGHQLHQLLSQCVALPRLELDQEQVDQFHEGASSYQHQSLATRLDNDFQPTVNCSNCCNNIWKVLFRKLLFVLWPSKSVKGDAEKFLNSFSYYIVWRNLLKFRFSTIVTTRLYTCFGAYI